MRLKKLVRKFRPSVIALAEPFLKEDKIPNFLGRFNCDLYLTNEEQHGKIWLLWNSTVSVHWLAGSNQFMSVKIEENGHVFVLTIVYAKCTQLERKMLWEDLEASGCGNLPWVICGDFNIIKNDSERRGGHPRPFAAMEDFNLCIHNNGWLDMCAKGPSMTWCNGQGGLARCWARLDRCFIDSNFLNCFPNVFFQVLARTTSDHSPLVIQMGEDPFRYGPSPFRFQFMWSDHSDFFRLVESVWNAEGHGVGLANLSHKLKRVKVALRDWNRSIFGRTDFIINQLEDRIAVLENRLQTCFNIDDDKDLLQTNLDLSIWRDREDTRLAHMVKKSWLQDGDQNSKFYHAFLNAKNHKRIKEMRLVDGSCLNTPYDIHNAAVDYFKNFLGVGGTRELPNLSDLISHVITEDENLALCRAPSLEDIKDALFSIPIDSSPGPDGFGSGFYRVCWDLVKDDLLTAISDFFLNNSFPIFYTASFIVLIPKVDKPSGFDKLHYFF
ncbi:hypothetical protein F2P56_005031 [Juglans regia]|uniref:Uncharacterized protein LOC109010394 n=2 Tax=Juglans regia TaxID=51240 RepID=A0A2I4GSB1_JUGRE|nr:uncharacterized protein LOC109010394 [Juglans regia]KAF5478473.1 hypothetical protein F2P56_005031 [Juglans regia]